MKFLTEHEARVAIAVRDQPGTSTQVAKRARVTERTARKCLTRLIEEGQVERIHTWPPQYAFIGDTGFVIRAATTLSKLATFSRR